MIIQLGEVKAGESFQYRSCEYVRTGKEKIVNDEDGALLRFDNGKYISLASYVRISPLTKKQV